MTERPSFLSAIVELHLSTREELEEALVRQLIYGADLATNILELGLAPEAGIGESLSRSSGLPYRGAPFEYDALWTAALLERGQRVLAHRSDGEVWVIASDIAAFEAAADVFVDVLGQAPMLAIGLAFRVEEALSMSSGTALTPRLKALVQQFGAHPATAQDAPSTVLPTVEPAVLPASPPEAPRAELLPAMPAEFEVRDHPPEVGITEPPPTNYAQITAEAAVEVASRLQAQPARTIDGGAMDAARKELLQARDRDAIFDIVLEVAAHYFEYAALFAISGSEARGLNASGAGNLSTDLSGLKIPLDLSGPFQKTVQTGTHQLVRLRASGLEGGVAQDLRRPTGKRVLLLPVVMRGRTVMMLWGDQGQADVDLGSVGEVISLGPAIAHAFERVLLERKRQSMIPQSAAAIGQLTGLLNNPPAPPAPPISKAADRPGVKISLASEYKPGPVEEALRDAPAPRRLEDRIAEAPPFVEAPSFEEASPIAEEASPIAEAPPFVKAPPFKEAPPVVEMPIEAPAPLSPSADITRRETNSMRPKISLDMEKPAGPSIARRASPKPISRFGPPSSSVDSTEHVATQRIAAAPEARLQGEVPSDEAPGALVPDSEVASAEKPGSHEVAPNPARTLEKEPAFPSEGPRTWKGFPGSPSPPSVVDAPAPAAAARAPAPLSRGPAPSLAMTPRRIVTLDSKASPPASPPPVVATSTVDREAAVEAPAPLFIPAEVRSTGTLISRRPLMNEPPEEGWGTTISPVPSRRPGGPKSYDELVERLCEGETSALDRLVDGGESAVASLIARFPGPVVEPESPASKASDSGPLLLALVRVGSKAIPFLTVRTADENPEVRRWATLVLGELASRDSAKAIAGRLLDSAPLVRRAALASARRLQTDMLARRTLRAQIEELTLDVKLGTEARCAAIEAIADIREYEAIPVLLQILGDKDRSVARASQWALSVLTRQDFGSDFVAWQMFWQEHRNEHRTEWLIAALGHEKADLRRAAIEELKIIAGQDFGFQEDLPEEERNEIQALVRTWWTRSGHKL